MECRTAYKWVGPHGAAGETQGDLTVFRRALLHSVIQQVSPSAFVWSSLRKHNLFLKPPSISLPVVNQVKSSLLTAFHSLWDLALKMSICPSCCAVMHPIPPRACSLLCHHLTSSFSPAPEPSPSLLLYQPIPVCPLKPSCIQSSSEMSPFKISHFPWVLFFGSSVTLFL